MSLNAVQTYLKEQLDGLTSPLTPAAQAWVLPPPITQPAENPQIYIWGGTLDEDRFTLPRFQGQKRVAHTVSMWIQYVTANDIEVVQTFPVFLDSIRAFLRSRPIPAALVDSTTGEASQLLNVGERILQEYGTPLALADQRLIMNTASMRCTAAEILNPA